LEKILSAIDLIRIDDFDAPFWSKWDVLELEIPFDRPAHGKQEHLKLFRESALPAHFPAREKV
jgi:hypothetical protein